MESYWILDGNGIENTAETFSFLKTQADKLKEETDGNVLAVFREKRVSPLEKALISTGELIPSSRLGIQRGVDATTLYGKKWYEFYITDKNCKYELAIFEIACNDEYPISLEIDETIADEAKLQKKYEVQSYSEFEGYFIDMIRTKKVTYVIRKLCDLQNERADAE